MSGDLTRRDFLKLAAALGIATADLLVPCSAGCGLDAIQAKETSMGFGTYRRAYVIPTLKEAHFAGKTA